MRLKAWEELPDDMRTPQVRRYYEILEKKKKSLAAKRLFDLVISVGLLMLLSPLMAVISLLIKVDSKGSVFYRQERVTSYGNRFRIHKFRTMVEDAQKLGGQITTAEDLRITKIGQILRGCRLDELPQLLDVIKGDMTFVGTRPEVPKYVGSYTAEMRATLLLPAGITSEASIRYKDEAKLLSGAVDVDAIYTGEILPQKMIYNLQALEQFSFWRDLGIMFRTLGAVLNI